MKRIFLIISLFATIFIFGCNNSEKIQIGDTVNITYTWKLTNWDIFENQTMTIIVWNWDIIKWIDKALQNKKTNQTFSIKLDPQDAYQDEYYRYWQQRISKNIFDRLWLSTEIWEFVEIDQISWTIIWQEEDSQWYPQIIIETNPPQTRQKTQYEIHINYIENKI